MNWWQVAIACFVSYQAGRWVRLVSAEKADRMAFYRGAAWATKSQWEAPPPS